MTSQSQPFAVVFSTKHALSEILGYVLKQEVPQVWWCGSAEPELWLLQSAPTLEAAQLAAIDAGLRLPEHGDEPGVKSIQIDVTDKLQAARSTVRDDRTFGEILQRSIERRQAAFAIIQAEPRYSTRLEEIRAERKLPAGIFFGAEFDLSRFLMKGTQKWATWVVPLDDPRLERMAQGGSDSDAAAAARLMKSAGLRSVEPEEAELVDAAVKRLLQQAIEIAGGEAPTEEGAARLGDFLRFRALPATEREAKIAEAKATREARVLAQQVKEQAYQAWLERLSAINPEAGRLVQDLSGGDFREFDEERGVVKQARVVITPDGYLEIWGDKIYRIPLNLMSAREYGES